MNKSYIFDGEHFLSHNVDLLRGSKTTFPSDIPVAFIYLRLLNDGDDVVISR